MLEKFFKKSDLKEKRKKIYLGQDIFFKIKKIKKNLKFLKYIL
jgi:hypothetical protein